MATTNGGVDNEDAVDALRRKREEAFREVGFAKVAEQESVSGYTTIGRASVSGSKNVTDSFLSTPLIDISNPNGSNNINRQMKQQQQKAPSPKIAAEAGLHRDGEQARLVEEVRRRQLQQHQHNEETTYQRMEESANQFWESLLVYGGLMDDPRNINNPINRSHHEATSVPHNPYRDGSSQTSFNGSSSNISRQGSSSQSSTATLQITSQPFKDMSKHRPMIRFILQIVLRILFGVRWAIDSCITCLARLERPPFSLYTYSASPVYSLQVTADDILCAVLLMWGFLHSVSRNEGYALHLGLVICLFIVTVGRKVVKRAQSRGYARQMQQRLQENDTKKQITIRKVSSLGPGGTALTEEEHSDHAIQRLQKQYPNATYAECKRFFKCAKFKEKAAANRLESYLKWRSDSGLKTIAEAAQHQAKNPAAPNNTGGRVYDQSFDKMDKEDWNEAAKIAIALITKCHVSDNLASLPQIVVSYEERLEKEHIGTNNKPIQTEESSNPPPRCNDRLRIFNLLPARLDLSLATAQTYSLAAALYFDRRLSRSTAERVALLVDVRGGRGWSNPTPWSLLPFVQSTASLLGDMYPERLERLILHPLPRSAAWVWSAAQKFLDPDTASKVVVVGAGEKMNDLPEGLKDYVNEASLAVLENRRRSFYTS